MVWVVLTTAWLVPTLFLLRLAAVIARRDRRLAAWRATVSRPPQRWLPPTPGG